MTTYNQRLAQKADVPYGTCSNCGKTLNLACEADVIECMCSGFLHPNENSSNMDDVERSLVRALEAHKGLMESADSNED